MPFLCGVLLVVVLYYLWQAIWLLLPGFWSSFVFALLGTAALIALELWVLLGLLQSHYSFNSPEFTRWIVLGRGAGFLAGLLGGIIATAVLHEMTYWGALPATNLSILLAASGISLLIVFLLAVPGILQQITGFKAAGVELTLSPEKTSTPLNLSGIRGVSPASGESGTGHEFSPWFDNYWPMFDLSEPKGVEFSRRAYFKREAAYLGVVDGRTIPGVDPDIIWPTSGPDPLVDAFWQQVRFIRRLRPIISCTAHYRKIFGNTGMLRLLLIPVLEELNGVEYDLEQIAIGSGDPELLRKDLTNRVEGLQTNSRNATRALDTSLSEIGAKTPSDDYWTKPSRYDCELATRPTGNFFDAPEDGQTLIPESDLSDMAKQGRVLPPYFAILTAELYGSLGSKDSGLRVLDRYNETYAQYLKKNPGAPRWFQQRAFLEYGLVQEADEQLPSTPFEWYYLDKLVPFFKRAWEPLRGKAPFVDCGTPRKPESATDEDGAAARLQLLLDDLRQRRIHALLATHTTRGGFPITTDDARDARDLLGDAERCLNNEGDIGRDYRQPLSLAAGGLLLAAWADEGPASGLLSSASAEDARRDALRALLLAFPAVRDEALKSRTQGSGLRISPNFWIPLAQRTESAILDLEGRIAH